VQRHQHRIHRVLDDAGVAPRRTGGDLLAFVQGHGGAGLREQRRDAAARDPAADDRDVRHRPIAVTRR
jgi:hypothetical protein